MIRLVASLIISCSLFCTSAQSDEIDSLLSLSLEELLQVRVSVASTKLESVIETPAIVSRYNRVDLEKLGITTLREMFIYSWGNCPGFTRRLGLGANTGNR